MTVMTDEQTMNTWTRVRHELMATVLLTLLLLAMAMLSAPVASAADEPGLQNNGAVEYVSGGIGKEEADALKQHSADYALTLEFASARSAVGRCSSTPAGRTAEIACPTFAGVSPPARITGRADSSTSRRLSPQSCVRPVAPAAPVSGA